jgi:hypothetical protein
MTKLLEKAVTAVSNLPEKDQDSIAAMILEELADEERWAQSFAASQRQLSTFAKEALEEYHSGRTKPLDL